MIRFLIVAFVWIVSSTAAWAAAPDLTICARFLTEEIESGELETTIPEDGQWAWIHIPHSIKRGSLSLFEIKHKLASDSQILLPFELATFSSDGLWVPVRGSATQVEVFLAGLKKSFPKLKFLRLASDPDMEDLLAEALDQCFAAPCPVVVEPPVLPIHTDSQRPERTARARAPRSKEILDFKAVEAVLSYVAEYGLKGKGAYHPFALLTGFTQLAAQLPSAEIRDLYLNDLAALEFSRSDWGNIKSSRSAQSRVRLAWSILLKGMGLPVTSGAFTEDSVRQEIQWLKDINSAKSVKKPDEIKKYDDIVAKSLIEFSEQVVVQARSKLKLNPIDLKQMAQSWSGVVLADKTSFMFHRRLFNGDMDNAYRVHLIAGAKGGSVRWWVQSIDVLADPEQEKEFYREVSFQGGLHDRKSKIALIGIDSKFKVVKAAQSELAVSISGTAAVKIALKHYFDVAEIPGLLQNYTVERIEGDLRKRFKIYLGAKVPMDKPKLVLVLGAPHLEGGPYQLITFFENSVR